jgi:hypothetical protein
MMNKLIRDFIEAPHFPKPFPLTGKPEDDTVEPRLTKTLESQGKCPAG